MTSTERGNSSVGSGRSGRTNLSLPHRVPSQAPESPLVSPISHHEQSIFAQTAVQRPYSATFSTKPPVSMRGISPRVSSNGRLMTPSRPGTAAPTGRKGDPGGLIQPHSPGPPAFKMHRMSVDGGKVNMSSRPVTPQKPPLRNASRVIVSKVPISLPHQENGMEVKAAWGVDAAGKPAGQQNGGTGKVDYQGMMASGFMGRGAGQKQAKSPVRTGGIVGEAPPQPSRVDGARPLRPRVIVDEAAPQFRNIREARLQLRAQGKNKKFSAAKDEEADRRKREQEAAQAEILRIQEEEEEARRLAMRKQAPTDQEVAVRAARVLTNAIAKKSGMNLSQSKPGGGGSLLSAFKVMDQDNSGKLTKSEFEDAIYSMGPILSKKAITALFHYLDMDKSGAIEYIEFTRMLVMAQNAAAIDRAAGRPFSPNNEVFLKKSTPLRYDMHQSNRQSAQRESGHRDMVWSRQDILAKQKMQAKVNESMGVAMAKIKMRGEQMLNGQSLFTACSFFDEDGDGKVTAKELAHVLETIGINVTGDMPKRIIEAYDFNGDGALQYNELVKAFFPKATIYKPATVKTLV
ncbi:hypothetical protein CYMTET_15759 [Cymbomonas tetramitiformis]|uniref:EF-hand domain-containing protein n=1 Tax=Cymbomonas tetramitiformis TaxID=36881 RepID=A0AAE0GDW2_9CHLO|nr:hypothetical protein CYMTET_15759 [Cymbomonas tetramitiformis]